MKDRESERANERARAEGAEDRMPLSVMRALRVALLRHSFLCCVEKETCMLRALRAVCKAGCVLLCCARLPALASSINVVPLRVLSEIFTGIVSSMLLRK